MIWQVRSQAFIDLGPIGRTEQTSIHGELRHHSIVTCSLNQNEHTYLSGAFAVVSPFFSHIGLYLSWLHIHG